MREQSDKIIAAVRATSHGPAGLRAARPQSLWRTCWRRFCRHRLALSGVTVLLVLTLGTLVGPLWDHPHINDIGFAASLPRPSLTPPLGAEDLGQGLFARIRPGGRGSLGGGLVGM